MCSTAFEPALPSIMADFGFSNGSLASFTVSVSTSGYVFGPLVIAPASELYRKVAVLYPGFVCVPRKASRMW